MTLLQERCAWLAGKPYTSGKWLEVTDKYTLSPVSRVPLADQETMNRAISAAAQATTVLARLPTYERRQILERCVAECAARAEELSMSLTVEAGKPIKDSRGEVARLIDTFRIAAEEVSRANGEVLALDIAERARGYRGMTKRVPVGPCAFITPFNFPLNLVAHKVAPAIAAGCPFILKPADRTPLGALIIGEILAKAGLPDGAFSILPCEIPVAEQLVADERIKLLSFTGSAAVGWALKNKAGKKKVVLELGGNAAVYVDESVSIDRAVERTVFGAFYQSGQSCISVQRVYVHQAVYETFRAKLVEKTRALKMGDPKLDDTFIGPVISERDAARITSWITDVQARGASLLCGGARDGVMVQASVLENVPDDDKLMREEVFGPVAVLRKVRDFDEAVRCINDSRYGLQAGLFTNNVSQAFRAWDDLEVGGVVIGDVPSFRVDSMPYGGVKDSGLGREGVRYAIEEMSETRLLVFGPTA